jgi:UDP-glucose 4-epimerase
MKYFVTGGAGFIGSNLVDRLLSIGHEVVVFDNLSTGQKEFLDQASRAPAFTMIRGDLLHSSELTAAMRGCEFVFHLAANADVRFGTEHPRKDLEQNTIGTFNVLEAMRSTGIKGIAFSSTGSVYGEPEVFPTPESVAFPVQTSFYAASKLACEGLIQAYCEGFGFNGWIFRFVSILGERYTHGHVFDFYMQLRENPNHLDVLGDGNQRKSYLYVQDCIDAILLALDKSKDKINILNLGADEYCSVKDSVSWIVAELGLKPEIRFTGGPRGWIGDSPFIFLDCSRMRGLGWAPRLKIKDAVLRTLCYLQANPHIREGRS